MKKDLLLEIHIDTDNPNSVSLLQGHAEFPFLYRLMIYGDRGPLPAGMQHDSPEVIVAKIAHELGHFIGEVAETPRAMNDPRSEKTTADELPTDDAKLLHYTSRVYASEQDAWDIAASLTEPTNQFEAVRAIALASYDPAALTTEQKDNMIRRASLRIGMTTFLESLLERLGG